MEQMTTDQLEETLAQNTITLVDVRDRGDFEARHIAQAQSLPLSQIDTFDGDQAEKVYLICTSGNRSHQAAAILEARGYQTVNVLGGMNAWTGETVAE